MQSICASECPDSDFAVRLEVLQASLIAQQINKKSGFYAMSTGEQPNPKVHQLLDLSWRILCLLCWGITALD